VQSVPALQPAQLSLILGRLGWFVVILLSLSAVAAALFTQHVLDMQPCPWCVLQRLIFVAIALAALPGALSRAPWARWASVSGTLVLALSGAAAALWQHFVAKSSSSCKLTLADRIIGGLGLDSLWPQVFAAYASCADAAVNLLGVPYEFYSLALYAVIAALALRIAMLRR